MATVKELEGKIERLQQNVNAVAAMVDKNWSTYQQDFMTLRQEVQAYFSTSQREERTSQPTETEPWRMELRSFIEWKANVKQDWTDMGNARIGQRLARALKRSSGHAEGQLYLNWCAKVGKPAVKAFWKSRGHEDVPNGLLPE